MPKRPLHTGETQDTAEGEVKAETGRGLSLLELTIRKGFCWNRLCDTQGESKGTAVLTEEPVHGKVGDGVVSWTWQSWVLIFKQHLSCQEASSIGDKPATCCRKHSTEGCIHPEEQGNQSAIRTGYILSTGSPI